MTHPFTVIEATKGKLSGQAAAQAAAHRHDTVNDSFAPLRQCNEIEWFTTGVSYFAAVAAAMKSAKKCIYIAGWQVNWDVQLTESDRLIDILHDRVQSSEDFRVYVMPWMSPKVGQNNHDFETMLAVFQLNSGRKQIQAMCCPAGEQSDQIGTEGVAYAHHQKLVVVDNELAFVGGMDLAYGRRDDEKFALNPGARNFNERYNPGVPPSRDVGPRDGPTLSLMDLLSVTLSAGHFHVGGDTEPGAISKALSKMAPVADQAVLGAIESVNKIARTAYQAPGNLYRGEKELVKSAVGGVNATGASASRMVNAAARGVSHECARVKIPDLFGSTKSLEVDPAATAGRGDGIARVDARMRGSWNGTVDDAAQLHRFLSPLQHLKVDPRPNATLPELARAADRSARGAYNVVIDGAAALAKVGEDKAEEARVVCVGLAPAVQTSTESIGSVVLNAEGKARSSLHETEAALNRLQEQTIESLNEARVQASAYLSHSAQTLAQNGTLGAAATVNVLADLSSQQGAEAVVQCLVKLLRRAYVFNLSIDWTRNAAHPALLRKNVKAPVASVLGPGQPRQPWEDITCRFKGPAVHDVAMNFIRRWNSCQSEYLASGTKLPLIANLELLNANGMLDKLDLTAPLSQFFHKLVDIAPLAQPPRTDQVKAPTGVSLRVLRSAPLKLRQQEANAMGDKVPPQGEQHEIHDQMINLIKGATDFIYIENQFFQSDFGEPTCQPFSDDALNSASLPVQYMMSGFGTKVKAHLSSFGKGAGGAPGKALLPHNQIGAALGDRIAEAVRMDQPFHVYIVLPTHPEGMLNDIAVIGQVHWTMQSLVFADNSLINRIKRAIVARQNCANVHDDNAWTHAVRQAAEAGDGGKPPYTNVAPEQWSQYLTLLNLRNCEIIDGRVRTEQIYVHSKLMIVDDRHAIVGSANINDRSQSGHRDSEIAVVLMNDTHQVKNKLRDEPVSTSKSVRALRTALWKKHFALSGGNGVVMPASGLASVIDSPAAEATIRAVQTLARDNAKLYRQAFPFVPWSEDDTGASIWPVCPKGVKLNEMPKYADQMPFSEAFWTTGGSNPRAPVGIRGFLMAFPINWTIGEYNHPGDMNVMTLTDASGAQKTHGTSPLIPAALNSPGPHKVT